MFQMQCRCFCRNTYFSTCAKARHTHSRDVDNVRLERGARARRVCDAGARFPTTTAVFRNHAPGAGCRKARRQFLPGLAVKPGRRGGRRGRCRCG
jgi:hypothetical protein